MTAPGNIEDIERQLRAPATSFRELLGAGAVFVRMANIVDALGQDVCPDNTPLRDVLPGLWPTVGDLRKLRDALVAAGWRPGEEF